MLLDRELINVPPNPVLAVGIDNPTPGLGALDPGDEHYSAKNVEKDKVGYSLVSFILLPTVLCPSPQLGATHKQA